ncbi:hypothetical protein [Dyadobacter sp. CY323]|uniref:hypothetical protein n=1 Tax=Dyadobacter sp. CY323 TaxID=2907302 RepID=UPI001F190A99|nr:hypothetical protein [Dyadobacter sp. CY323]MCE6992280.1 hypothetical protein [Dyadobacter sp. CY323]
MSLSRAEKLIQKLISNKLSGKELSELLEGISSEKEQKDYSDALETYFNELLNANHPNGASQSGKPRPGEAQTGDSEQDPADSSP